MAWCICDAQALQHVCGCPTYEQDALPAKQRFHLLPHMQVLNSLVHKHCSMSSINSHAPNSSLIASQE